MKIPFYIWAAWAMMVMMAVVAWSPRCQPGDRGTYIGNMLVVGCPAAR